MIKLLIAIDLTLIKDIVLIIGSVTGTLFAFRGFNKWKKEHKGRIRYELSRDILKSIYNLNDTFNGTRSSIIHAFEFSNEHTQSTKVSEKHLYVFQNRLKYLNDSFNKFKSLLPEVKIEYGEDVLHLCDEICKQVSNYHLKVNEYIQLVDNMQPDNPYHQELRKVIFNIDSKNNKTKKSFDLTISNLEKKLNKEIKKY